MEDAIPAGRGTGLYFERYEKAGYDPKHGQQVTAIRRRIKVDEALPMKDSYTAFIRSLLARVREAEAAS